VRDALIDVDLDEPMALEALTRLYELGILVPAPPPQAPALVEELETAPAEASVLDGLPQEALRQLEAFQIRTVSDKPVRRPRLELLGAPVLEVHKGPPEVRLAVPPVKRARLAVAEAPVVAEPPALRAPEEAKPVTPAPKAEAPAASSGRRAWVVGAVVVAALALAAVTAYVRESAEVPVAPASTDQQTP
jgi:hypothetical protein